MQAHLSCASTFQKALCVILDDVMALHGAEFGNVQLPVGDDLVIAAQRGFKLPFLNAFARVRKSDSCACGRAFLERRTVVIPDVEKDLSFAPYRHIAREAGFRAVQSTPLFTTNGDFMGMVSSHCSRPGALTQFEIAILTEYSVIAAQHLHQLGDPKSLSRKILKMSGVVRKLAQRAAA